MAEVTENFNYLGNNGRTLVCSNCNIEIKECDECWQEFLEGDQIVCNNEDHFHNYCAPGLSDDNL